MRIVECVPNFSEGRDLKVIDQISEVIKAVDGATLLDVDPGADTNRTVVTIVGEPEPVMEAAFQAIKKASQLIDMTKHSGAHPRMGATDVCPFVPVSGVTMDDCVEFAKKVGKRVGDELGIPIYLYEYAASKPEWKNLANVRKGEYEGLKDREGKAEWKPDFGPHKFNPKAGATAVSAREFLIAYNINLNTRDKKKAHDLALTIRERGRWARDEKRKIIRDENGKKVRQPGLFKFCKAVGWYIDEYNRAQISINLTNYKVTPPHLVLEKVRELAVEKGIQVTGSELVGLLPKEAILMAGRYYLDKLAESSGIPEKMIIETAIQSMGLDDLSEFDINEKVIEYAIAKKDNLVNMTLVDFADELSSDSPAPGGGSVAALCSSMSGALSAMVSNLTFGKKGYKKVWEEAKELAVLGQKIKEDSIYAIDKDTQAFYEMMDAARLPKKTDEDKKIREEAMQEATKNAILVPLETLEIALRAAELSQKVAAIGNANALSDAGVAAITANAAAKSAYLNVKINMAGIEDENFKFDILTKADTLLEKVNNIALKVEKEVQGKV
ncbi:MAG: glutamate formimidoyltransferase [Candidatus Cloacimonetes bacterium]|nr:glutamate formimidoyltransferase [Candidatus Cloacimonadota bacterium]MCF7813873.1 glutamate formimidoyltransferase [Candidatus Cloacimonadota bacterium]MCF7868916.1 glutamate formimidoyltransferase [Candidatus Cloacimonadota bacterium]MCF7883985.1 glutamate formimidoyltransferase [Candidatus Cloacimonadota bacterium]